MEVNVEVRTVHPVSDVTKAQGAKITHNSWGTPEATPVHNAPANSNVHTRRHQKEDLEHKADITLQMQRVRFISSSPPPEYEITETIKDEATELKDLEMLKFEKNSAACDTLGDEKSATVEIPQSPVPTSPTRFKKWKGFFRMSFFCDLFLPIDPQGRAYISWLLLVTFCYIYNAWCIILRATFPYQTPENTPSWLLADYFCDAVYLMDVAFVKPRLMYLEHGFWVKDFEKTKRNYMSTLQYKFDVISLLPLDLLYLYYGTEMVLLRLPRLLKLQTAWEFHQTMDRLLSSPYVVRMGKTLFYLFYLIHINACAYYSMSKYIGIGTNGWVYDNQGIAYIRCFYFATKTVTSIGKNPKPENNIEYLYMTVAWLVGIFVYALLISQVRDIIATASKPRAEYQKSVDASIRYLRNLNMPDHVLKRVSSWFTHIWNEQRYFDEAKILNSLPINMRRDVALAVHMAILSKVQLFQDCSDSLLRDLVLQLRPVSFLPGDLVVGDGEVGHEMYIIKTGECCVMSHDETEVLAVLKAGSVFGEISLLGIQGLRRRTATVRSRGYSDLFALSRNDLDAALKNHEEAAQILRLRADQIIQENASRQAKLRMAKLEAKKLSGLHDDVKSALRRKKSSNSSNNSGHTAEARNHRSGRRLSVVSENKS